MELRYLDRVQFRLLSPEKLRRDSKVHVTENKSYNENGKKVECGLLDTRMGDTEMNVENPTDLLNSKKTPGYFGHIELNVPVYNLTYIGTILKILNVTCFHCGSLLMNTDNNNLDELNELVKKEKKNEKELISCNECGEEQPRTFKIGSRGLGMIDADDIHVYPEYVQRLFMKIRDTNWSKMGFNIKESHPCNMILQTIPVCSPLMRPSKFMGSGLMFEDHLTLKYKELMKNNRRVGEFIGQNNSKNIEKWREFIQYDVATLFDNEQQTGINPSKEKSGIQHRTFGQRIKGISEKEGRIRKNLMSKRVELSARSVISPDPVIDLNEIGFPKYMAMKLTRSEIVTRQNIREMSVYAKNGNEVYPGCKKIIKRRGYIVNDDTALEVGDIVHRHLIDGDYVLVNRQPTLHKFSMMGHRVRVIDGLTIRLNVNVTEPYNADFDGDEMNIHVPQSIAASNELSELAGLDKHCMSAASNGVAIRLIQDNILAGHIMRGKNIPGRAMMNILALGAMNYRGYLDESVNILDMYVPYDLESGREIRQLIRDVYHENKNKRETFRFINDIQHLFRHYLNMNLFSIGPKDLDDDLFIEKKEKLISDFKNEIYELPRASESEVQTRLVKLDKAGDDIMKKDKSRFMTFIKSKSKGKIRNVRQIKGFLGQQLVNGSRIHKGFEHRTLPHFYRYEEKLENYGFVESSFNDGLSPTEFMFHAAGARDGLIDQALQTPQTGYMQRQMIKVMENVIVHGSGFVQDRQGHVLQFDYGDDGFDGENIRVTPTSKDDLVLTHAIHLNESDWKACLDSKTTETEDFQGYFKTLSFMHRNITERYKEISIPIDYDRLIELTRRKHSLSKGYKTDLKPSVILREYDKYCRGKNYMTKYCLYYYCGPKRLIVEERFTQDAFYDFMTRVDTQLKQSTVDYGEAVGILAASSIGEPSTQLALNSFHAAGSGQSQGVPRLKELMQMSETGYGHANMRIVFEAPHKYIKTDVLHIKEEFESTYVKDVFEDYRIERGKADYTAFLRDVGELRDTLGDIEEWTIEFILTDSKYSLQTWEAFSRDEEASKYLSRPWIRENKVTCTFDMEIFCRDGENRHCILTNVLVERSIEKLFLSIQISGLDNEKRPLRDVRVVECDCDQGQRQWVCKCTGTNLEDILGHPGIDGTKTVSDSVNDTYNVLGIEAARLTFIQELNKVLSTVAHVDIRHITLLADRLLSKGKLNSLTLSGLNQYDEATLSRASFTNSLKEFQNAALYGHLDNLQDIPSCIMTGKAVACGTGSFDVQVDESLMKSVRVLSGTLEEEQQTGLVRFDVD